MEIVIVIVGLIVVYIGWRISVIRKKNKAIEEITYLQMKKYDVPDKYLAHVNAVVAAAYNGCGSIEEFNDHVEWRITEIKNGGGIDNNGRADNGESLQ